MLAVNPETRRLIKIAAVEKDDHVEFVKLMNDDISYRRKMLGLPDDIKADSTEENERPKKRVPQRTIEAATKKRKISRNHGKVARKISRPSSKILQASRRTDD